MNRAARRESAQWRIQGDGSRSRKFSFRFEGWNVRMFKRYFRNRRTIMFKIIVNSIDTKIEVTIGK